MSLSALNILHKMKHTLAQKSENSNNNTHKKQQHCFTHKTHPVRTRGFWTRPAPTTRTLLCMAVLQSIARNTHQLPTKWQASTQQCATMSCNFTLYHILGRTAGCIGMRVCKAFALASFALSSGTHLRSFVPHLQEAKRR